MKKFLSLVLALAMTLSLVTISAGAKDFTDSGDISSDDYAEAIDVMSALEIIDGYGDGDFRPQGTLTRGAAAKIIACMMLGKTTAEALGTQAAPFKDVPVGSTFAGYIAYCVEAGLIDGYADGTFRPSNTLTGFAFLKMLLTAMGYDSSIEGFTGTNWTVNVARRAIENGLTDGNDNFIGNQPATREQACLYAVNTIKATLVEYESKGSSITINGAEIVTGATAPKVVTSVNKDQATSINNDEYVTGASGQASTWTVEFGEKYMPKLSLKGSTDDFARPVHIWDYKGAKIGTYTDDADLEYTEKVASDTIYDDLGLTGKVSASLYVDGVYVDANGDYTTNSANAVNFLVENNNTTKTGDTGILTQVWKGGDYDSRGKWVTTVKITQVHYYVGDVVGKTAATSNRDAYVTIVGRGLNADTLRSGNFTTEDFAIDDVVVYNYSQAVSNPQKNAVQNVIAPDTAAGTLTSFTTGDSATVGGTKYDYSCTVANEAATAAVNTDVTVVLDPFGYAIDVDGKNEENYAVVLDVNDVGDLRKEADLLFADGSHDIVATSQDYGSLIAGDIVSYTIKSGEKYQLTKKAAADTTSGVVSITNGAYNFTAAGMSPTAYTANGKTIFLVKTADANGNAMYNAYQGIKNVPTIATTGDITMTVFCKTAGNLATVVYVDASNRTVASVLNPSSDVIFVKGNNDGVSYTYEIGNYYLHEAIVNGELRDGSNKLMTSAKYAAKGQYALFDGVSYDANNVATLADSNGVISGTGVYKMANDVLGTYAVDYIGGTHSRPDATVGNYAYYPVADDCKIAFVNEDGDLQTGYTISSVTRDTNDLIWFKLNASNEITYAFILKVDGGTNPEVEQYNLSITAPSTGYTYTITDTAGAVVKTATMVSATETVAVNKGTYTVTISKAGSPTLSRSVTVTESTSVDFATGAYTLTVNSIPTSQSNDKLTIKNSSGAVVFEKSSVSATETATLLPGSYTVSFSADGYETQTKSVTISNAAASATFDSWNTVTIAKVGVNSTVTLSKDGVAVASVTNSTVSATLNVVGAVTGYDYAITATDAVVVGGTGTVSGASFTANEKVYKLDALTLATGSGSGTMKLTAAAASSYTTLTSSETLDVTYERMNTSGDFITLITETGVAGDKYNSATDTPVLNVDSDAAMYRVTVTVKAADGTVLDTATATQFVTLGA